jgi:hypothetical protein
MMTTLEMMNQAICLLISRTLVSVDSMVKTVPIQPFHLLHLGEQNHFDGQ